MTDCADCAEEKVRFGRVTGRDPVRYDPPATGPAPRGRALIVDLPVDPSSFAHHHESIDRLSLERVGLTKAVADLRAQVADLVAERDTYRSRCQLAEDSLNYFNTRPLVSTGTPPPGAPPAVVTVAAAPSVPPDPPRMNRAGRDHISKRRWWQSAP